MISYEYALNRAKEYLEDSEIPLQITSEGEFFGGWFFCYQSVEYLKTGNSSDQLAGNCPFVIDRITGELHELGTDKPLDEYLQEYLVGR